MTSHFHWKGENGHRFEVTGGERHLRGSSIINWQQMVQSEEKRLGNYRLGNCFQVELCVWFENHMRPGWRRKPLKLTVERQTHILCVFPMNKSWLLRDKCSRKLCLVAAAKIDFGILINFNKIFSRLQSWFEGKEKVHFYDEGVHAEVRLPEGMEPH